MGYPIELKKDQYYRKETLWLALHRSVEDLEGRVSDDELLCFAKRHPDLASVENRLCWEGIYKKEMPCVRLRVEPRVFLDRFFANTRIKLERLGIGMLKLTATVIVTLLILFNIGCASPTVVRYNLPPALSEVYRNGQLPGMESDTGALLGTPAPYDQVPRTCRSQPIYSLHGIYIRTDVRCF